MKSLNEMTRKELLDLKRRLDTKLNDDRMSKTDIMYELDAYARLYSAVFDIMRSEGITIEPYDPEVRSRETWCQSLDRAIFKIADLTLGNYNVATSKALSDDKVPSTVGAYLQIDNPNLYKSMVDDILKVIEKYHRVDMQQLQPL